MSELKSLLLHVGGSALTSRRLSSLHRLARQHGARLEALHAVTPVLRQYPYSLNVNSQTLSELVAREAQSRARARVHFERECAAAGVPLLEWSETHEDPVSGFKQRAFAADLMVLPQHDPESDEPAGVPADFAATLLVETGKPGLVLPYIEAVPGIGNDVLIAWKSTPESARAVTAALPILKLARSVHVATWDHSREADAGADCPAIAYLARHGVAATWHREGPATRDLGELLLSRAADLQADLLVMGCYGHGRAREWALGGVTRTIFHSMTLPVLMAH